MSFNVGENVGPYRIVEQLGQGGMATVFKAYHASLDRYVALKVLHPAFNQDPNFEARFQREARVVAKLEHPHIVPVYDYAEHEKRPFLVMKFIEGITLKARMDQGSLSSNEIMKIVDAVGSALAYAHKQGILHRDIKPSNVLLANDGQIYLADFGLARIAQSGESTLSSDMIMGTPQYISPEQAMGKKDLDQRTDLYSFGVMLYEMAVGKVPFNADTPFSIIHDHIFSPLPMPRAVNPNVTEAVERVLLKALAKERVDRFEDATQLASAFKNAWSETGLPVREAETKVSPVQADKQTVIAEQEPARVVEATAPTKITSAPETVARVEEKVQSTESVPGSGKKRSVWTWVGVVLLVILCVAGLAITRNIRQARLSARQTKVPATAPAAHTPVGQQNQTKTNADEHLRLALEAWNQKDLKRSMDEVTQVTSMRGDQTEYLLEAGKQLFDAGQFIGAAHVYGRTAQNFRDKKQEIPFDVLDRLEQSLYFATAMDAFPLYIPLDLLKERDSALGLFASSRYALLHGNMDVARRDLDELRRAQPDWPLTQLLDAEVLMQDGKVLEPRKLLDYLITAPNVPEWIKGQAKVLFEKLQ